MEIDCLDGLDVESLKSVLKSNRFTWEERRLIKRKMMFKSIEEFVPTILMIVVAQMAGLVALKALNKRKFDEIWR